MPLFAKKKSAVGLTDQIMAMRQQGMPNEQIIQILQGQGTDPSQIFDAMNQIDAGGQMQPGMPPGAPPAQGAPGPPPPGMYPYAQGQMPPDQMQYGGEDTYAMGGREKIEEVAESIIDEKWNDLLKDINKISEFNHKTEIRLSKIETEIKNLKDNFDSLHKGILGKITEYDQNLVNVGTEIKAMEKVFQKILPAFTDNVSKLARITEGFKVNNKKKF